MAWRVIGDVTMAAATKDVAVGWVELPPEGGVEVRVIQLSPADDAPYLNGLMWFQTNGGRSLGTRKFWGHIEGEDYRIGEGLSTGSGRGMLMASPRAIVRRNFLKPGRTWSLRFMADEPSPLPPDRHMMPGFVEQLGRLLGLTRVGTQGRIQF